jgi:hypothetical protein
MEIKSDENLLFLSKSVLQNWHKKANDLDAYCCENQNSVTKATAQCALDSYLTTRQLANCLESISEKRLKNNRVYCSWDPQFKEIQAIVIQKISENNQMNIEFAVTNPDNLAILPKQSKHMTGSVAVIIINIFQENDLTKEVHCQVKDSALNLAERVGFERSLEKAQAIYLTPMKISREKAQKVMSSVNFKFQKEKEEFSLRSRFSFYQLQDKKNRQLDWKKWNS